MIIDTLSPEKQALIEELNFLTIAEKNASGWARFEISKKLVKANEELILFLRKNS